MPAPSDPTETIAPVLELVLRAEPVAQTDDSILVRFEV
jgi:hypothetical protein